MYFPAIATGFVNMDFRDLRLFVHLSQSLHFGRSSRECHVSPSSLSRIIQKLEQETGAVLFERDNRTVKLTRAGTLFRAFAEDSLARWSDLQNELHQKPDELTGRLSVFCSVTASYSFLHELLAGFRNKYPLVQILLHTGDSALAVQRVLDDEEDIGIAAQPDRLPDTLTFLPIAESPLVFIAPTMSCPVREVLDSAEKQGMDYPWDEVPFIVSETGLARTRVDRWFRDKGVRPDIYARVSGNEAIVSMVGLGFGVAVVPELVVENSPGFSKVTVMPVEPELTPFSIGICSLRRKMANPLVEAFWRHCSQHFAARQQ